MLSRSFAPFFLAIFAVAAPARADFICQSDVAYKWKKAGEEAERTVPLVSVQQAGPDEAKAKAALVEFLNVERARAKSACEDAHQNTARCIGAKYSAMGTVLQNQSFTARKALEEAIAKDCQADQGACGDVIASDPKCSERASTEKEDEGGKKDKEKEKDKGKGKK